jgi:hypothetical protein
MKNGAIPQPGSPDGYQLVRRPPFAVAFLSHGKPHVPILFIFLDVTDRQGP